VSRVLIVVVITCSLLSLSSYFLGFGPDLQIGGAPRSRKHLDNFILPLGSGVVSYWLHKVYLSTCSSFHVGVETPDS
jgi:dolichol kinase